jgi:hypothetical protein
MNSDARRSGRPAVIRAVLILLAPPVIGLLLGITFDRLVLLPRSERTFIPPNQIPGTELDPAMRAVFVRRLGKELGLSDSQRTAVEALIEKHYPRVRAAGDSARAVFERATVEPRSEMMQLLTPAQQRRMTELTGMPVLPPKP